jgi:phosphate transport system protein
MPRESYQSQLETLRSDVKAMADLVMDRYADALEAYDTGDRELAEAVIEGDHDVNQRYLDLESDCIELLALQQPVAGDLRCIASSFKIITDLERVGDLATNLAEYSLAAEGHPHSAIRLRKLGDQAGAMLADAMEAYVEGDADAAWEVAARDDDVDRACEQASERVVRELLDTESQGFADGEANEHIDTVSRALLTIRDLERVGDHAVNICARTLYMVENDEGLIY